MAPDDSGLVLWILVAFLLLRGLLNGLRGLLSEHSGWEARWWAQELKDLRREIRKQRRVLQRIEHQVDYAIDILHPVTEEQHNDKDHRVQEEIPLRT